LRQPPTRATPRPEAQQNLAEKRIAPGMSRAINAADCGVGRFFGIVGGRKRSGFRYVAFTAAVT
jgi:hypothetical protein